MTLDNELSLLFILKDFMNAFFGIFDDIVTNKNKLAIKLETAVASTRGVTSKCAENDLAKESLSYRRGAEMYTKGSFAGRVEKRKTGFRGRGDKNKERRGLARQLEDALADYRRESCSLALFITQK